MSENKIFHCKQNLCLVGIKGLSTENDRRGLEICQTLSFWIKMANRVWKGGFEEDMDKNAKNSCSLTLLPVDCLNLNSDQPQ